jgi:hypothetical protein
MPYADPKECTSLPFQLPEPVQSGVFAIPIENAPYGYRRIAPSQAGFWTFQPKYTLYRVAVNTAKRSMFNKWGICMPEASSGLYQPQLKELSDMFPNCWLDAFIRVVRSGDTDMSYGQGSFLLNDIFKPELEFYERMALLSVKVKELGICRKLPHRSIYRVPNFPEHISLALWAALLEVDQNWKKKGAGMYSGVIGKASKSQYSPNERDMQSGCWIQYPFCQEDNLVDTALAQISHALES